MNEVMINHPSHKMLMIYIKQKSLCVTTSLMSWTQEMYVPLLCGSLIWLITSSSSSSFFLLMLEITEPQVPVFLKHFHNNKPLSGSFFLKFFKITKSLVLVFWKFIHVFSLFWIKLLILDFFYPNSWDQIWDKTLLIFICWII